MHRPSERTRYRSIVTAYWTGSEFVILDPHRQRVERRMPDRDAVMRYGHALAELDQHRDGLKVTFVFDRRYTCFHRGAILQPVESGENK